MARYEELKTPEAVLAAFDAGRRVEYAAMGGDWVEPKHLSIPDAEEAILELLEFGDSYRALIEEPAPSLCPNCRDDGACMKKQALCECTGKPAIPAGYKPWSGGECPPGADKIEVSVIYRSGKTGRGTNYCWWLDPQVIAYRVESEQAQKTAPFDDILASLGPEVREAIERRYEELRAQYVAQASQQGEALAAEVIALAKEREEGYRKREHGDVLNARIADKVVSLGRRLAGGEGA